MKARVLSVDVGQVLVVPIEVATGVEPPLGAGVRVGAHLEPPERHTNTESMQFSNLQTKDNIFSLLYLMTLVYFCGLIITWGGYIFTHAHLLAGLSAGLHKNYLADLHHSRLDDGSQAQIRSH